jgi:hypothetical protein
MLLGQTLCINITDDISVYEKFMLQFLKEVLLLLKKVNYI